MNDKLTSLVGLIDYALAVAEARLQIQPEVRDYTPVLEAIIAGLRQRRDEALSGTLPSSEGGTYNLGLTRAVLDWDSQYSELVKACGAVDLYYSSEF